MRSFLVLGLLVGWGVTSSFAQDRFRTPIPTSDLQVRIETFATIPDSSNRQPARMSVLTTDPAGRLFVNDQRGPLYLVDRDSRLATEYLDLRDYRELAINSSNGEAGFQGFAWHPDFANTGTDGFGRFYTIHSSNSTRTTPDFDPGGSTSFHTLLLEWRTGNVTGTTFEPANPAEPYRELMRLKQPFANHNAGLIAFNPHSETDRGNLYIAMGDGGLSGDPQENGQDSSNPYGALLRINPLGNDSANGRYGIVADNVLAADANPNTLGEIYAYGLRNPQRFGWDSLNGNLFIADIGQNAIEEINLGINGGNYGWDDREGSFRFESNNTQGLIDPVAEYDHTNTVTDPPTPGGNRAVTLGDVARGTGIPGLDGNLLISDFPTGLMFTLDVDNDPLDGGQDGLFELRPLDENGTPVRLLELINQTLTVRGLSPVTRADLRYSVNTPGEVFVLNKQDGILRRLTAIPEPLPGDFNSDGALTVEDIDALSAAIAIQSQDAQFDLNGDQSIDLVDLNHWVVELKQTWIGDADLNGEFGSGDFVAVFAAGEYEDAVAGNSTWAEGDWNADLDFNSADFIAAFLGGGYEQGPRPMVPPVPEPNSLVLVLAGMILIAARRLRPFPA